jgi:hypothetical protein
VTLDSVVWANALRGISPTAKLIAIDLAGVSGAEEIGKRSVQDLADFACCAAGDVEVALAELGSVLVIEREQEEVRAIFPTRRDEREIIERRRRNELRKAQRPCHLYVISKGGKVKIGISQQLQKRLEALATSFPIALQVLLTASGPHVAIRRAEREAHEALKDSALGGEYFDVTHERALEVTKASLLRNDITRWAD